MAYLYRHIRLDTNMPFYIGIGVRNRAYSTHNRNKYWHHIVNKVGYEVEIVLDDLIWGKAVEKEKEFIKLYGRKDNGTGVLINLTDGGEGMLGWKCPDEIKKALSAARKGQPCTNKGYIHNEKVRQLMSLKGKGVPKSLGRKLSEETKNKIRVAATEQAINNGSKKAVVFCSIDGTIIKEYSSVKEAARSTNNSPQTVMGSCKRKNHRGNYWRLKND